MITVSLSAFSDAPGSPPATTVDLYQEERLSYALYSFLHDAYNQGVTLNQEQLSDFSSANAAVDTWVADLETWLDASEIAVSEGELVPSIPSIPDIISSLPAIIAGVNPIVAIALRVALTLAGKWIEHKLNPGNLDEVAQAIESLKECLQGEGESPLKLARILELALLDDVDNDKLLSTIKMAAHRGIQISLSKGDEFAFVSEESLPDGL